MLHEDCIGLVKNACILGGKISTLLLNHNVKLSKNKREPILDPTIYRMLIKRLMYLTPIISNLIYSV